ncbi:hypothetical protein ACL9RL_09505 [Plantibacter sp. Mn2098]|uniref:hypothetical protein n=1 Tax=Plantibacter sp. Mn2098 TaxID=3395266 RepID=UPI003BDCD21C
MKARIVASIVLAGALALGTAGCNLIAPQATTKHYDASDGVSVTVGKIGVRNALIISDDGVVGNLVFSVSNTDTKAHTVVIEVEGNSERFQVVAEPGITSFDGRPDSNAPVRIDELGAKPGAVIRVFFQYGTETGGEALVPILTGELNEYSTLVPTEAPSPTPSEIPTPASTTVAG